MPKVFEDCVKNGGKVRTIIPKSGRYLHVCYPKGGGAPISGEVKKNHLAETMKNGKPS